MRLLFLLRLLTLLPALVLAGGAARAQTEHASVEPAELAVLAARFPAARYGVLTPLPATRSPVAAHRTWRFTAAGRWRWPATVRTSVAATDGRVLSVFADAVRPLPALDLPATPPDSARGARLTSQYLRRLLPVAARAGAVVRERVAVWYPADSTSNPAEKPGWLLTWGHPDTRIGAWEVLLDDATGQPVGPPRDLLCYHRADGPPLRSFFSLIAAGKKQQPISNKQQAISNKQQETSNTFFDTTALALVFRPDPLTTAQRPYGRPFIDSLDADRPALNRQRVLDTLWLTFAQDSFRLRNAGFRVAEFDPPARPVVAARTAAGLQFKRAAAGFQQVNALCHLTRAWQYVRQLGYGSLHPRPLRVDASGLSGADQSRFSPIDTTLSFGEGGVDDAEDADVLVHEYCHALAFAAAPGTNTGRERRTLDEANADYWAAAHSARLGGPAAFGREQVFNWDGHNEFWAGRWVISPKHYPRDLVGDIYLDAEVWSATLWQIRAALPPAVADRLFWQHLYAYAPNLTMPQAAALLLQADTLLYGAAHAAVIYQHFDARRILGTHVVVGEEAEAEEEEGGASAAAGAQLWATDAFGGGGAARFRSVQAATLTLLSATGAVVWRGAAAAATETPVPAAALPPGLYLLRWQTTAGAGTARLLRW